MSAIGDFYMRACELAGLDPADLPSIDKVSAALETAAEHTNHPFILTDTKEQLLERVVATLRQAPRPCTRCTMTVSGLHDGNVVNGRTYCRECSGIVAQTPTDRRERAERAR